MDYIAFKFFKNILIINNIISGVYSVKINFQFHITKDLGFIKYVSCKIHLNTV